jgi:NADP-dependent 3-hydroxy acid dehydrogenase YdfG
MDDHWQLFRSGALAAKVVEHGYRAVVTARNPDAVGDLVARFGDRAIAVGPDGTQGGEISSALKAAHERFGEIDVLVNNADYGYIGAIEEGDENEIRAQFETRVHRVIALFQAVLPGMRLRAKGQIVNVGSIVGLTTFPNVG